MVQGTGSDVGKSLIVAGLCRAYAQRGLAVRPFKPQNMSNNAAVVPGGGEIGRAQALQARACGVPPSCDMNPVLLKPETDTGAQIIVHGQVRGTAKAREFQSTKCRLMPAVLESFARLESQADLVVVEGAGSPAEINLPGPDLANMGFAEAAGVPVLLVGDIDRGGVIASIVGTHVLLEEGERALVRGYVINKFRGDATLFDPALGMIGERTGLECFGIVPFFAAARLLPKEDAMALDNDPPVAAGGAIRIAVLRLARIANFDDLDPLAAEDDVALSVVEPGSAVPGDADVVLIPGSKATLADLAFLRAQGWDVDVMAHRRRGGVVVGLCGGYQMLGRRVCDPDGVEGPSGEAAGLGLLDVVTVIGGAKTLELTAATDNESGEAVEGYQIHMGETSGADCARPWLTLADGSGEGAVSPCGRVMGSYLHGVFAADGFRRAFLGRVRPGAGGGFAFEATIESTLDSLALHLEANLDLDRLLAVSRAG